MPRASASSLISTMTTGIPTFAKHMAIPPPIVPPPMMATFLMSRSGVSLGRSLIFAAWRSAKKICRIAADSGDVTNSRNNSRSRSKPSSIGRFTAASMQDTILSGAICPRARKASFFLAASKKPGSIVEGSIVMSRTLFNGAPEVTKSFAYLIAAACRSSPSTTSSTRPMLFAFAAATGLPVVIISSAAFTPANRGTRCVPPAPGRRPNLTSGKPTFADAIAQR